MTLDTVIMLAGAFVAVLPFLGFPNRWDTVFFFLAGVLIIILGIIVRRRLGHISRSDVQSETFVENLPSRQAGVPREVEHEV